MFSFTSFIDSCCTFSSTTGSGSISINPTLLSVNSVFSSCIAFHSISCVLSTKSVLDVFSVSPFTSSSTSFTTGVALLSSTSAISNKLFSLWIDSFRYSFQEPIPLSIEFPFTVASTSFSLSSLKSISDVTSNIWFSSSNKTFLSSTEFESSSQVHVKSNVKSLGSSSSLLWISLNGSSTSSVNHALSTFTSLSSNLVVA